MITVGKNTANKIIYGAIHFYVIIKVMLLISLQTESQAVRHM